MAILKSNRDAPNPSAKMKASYAICSFASGRGGCDCRKNMKRPCDAMISVATEIIECAKEELKEKYVLRKKPIT